MVDGKTARAAFERLIAAANAKGEPDLVARALEDDVRVERFGFHERKGQLREVFEGAPAVATWFQNGPWNPTTWWLEGEVRAADQGRWTVRYALEVSDFHGGGTWTAALGPSGRIAWLMHDPDDLPDDLR